MPHEALPSARSAASGPLVQAVARRASSAGEPGDDLPLHRRGEHPSGRGAVIKRAYKFRAYPTCRQEQRAKAMLDAHRQLYNAALEERREAWRRAGLTVRYAEQSAQLKEIRRADPDGQGRWSFTSQQQTLRRLDRAFQAFFHRLRLGGKAGYPRFKSAARWDSVDFVDGDGARWRVPEGRWARAYFQGVGQVKVKAHRPTTGRVKMLRIKREGRRWYVIIVAEQQPVQLPTTGREIGLDVGVARFATTSDGQIVGNPRFLAAAAGELADAQRAVARCRSGSGNRRRARGKLAKLHRLVANRRRDFHHQTARMLIDTCDVIAVEGLAIANMTSSARGTIHAPGHNVGQKAALNRSILDAGWGQFLSILVAKAEGAGRRVVKVNPWRTSILCHRCGASCARPSQAIVICPVHCAMDADLNGARNILTRAGLGSGRAA
jgi:putative transposase